MTTVIIKAYIHEKCAWVVNVGIIHERRIDSWTRQVTKLKHIAELMVDMRKAYKYGIQQIYAANDILIGGNEAAINRPLTMANNK
jgi:hypothetical protein